MVAQEYTRPEVKEYGKNTSEFLENYEKAFDDLLKEKYLPPGMAVTLISNLNLLSRDMPARVFRNIDYARGFEVPEDRKVFAAAYKRIKSGKVIIEKPVMKKAGEFTLNHNFVRGLRPIREARRSNVSLKEPPNKNKFNYSTQLCDYEVFETQKDENGLEVELLQNRYPFAPFHFLWVPERKKVHGQFIDLPEDEKILQAAVNFICNKGYGPSVRLCYNSLGAHASVNHLHFQGFFNSKTQNLPIDKYIKKGEIESDKFYFKGSRWIPRKNLEQGLIDNISEMNQRWENGEKIAYSFYLTPQGATFFPRKHQGDKKYFQNLVKADFSTGFAFYEMLGEILPKRAEAMEKPKEAESKIKKSFELLALP